MAIGTGAIAGALTQYTEPGPTGAEQVPQLTPEDIANILEGAPQRPSGMSRVGSGGAIRRGGETSPYTPADSSGEGYTGGGEDLLSRFMELYGKGGGGGGGGGGGTGGGSFDPTAGTTNVGDEELVRLLQGLVSGDLQNEDILSADPALREQLLGVISTLEGQRGKLVKLDPQVQRDLEAQRALEEGLVNQQIQQMRDDLLTRLFGSGQATSTIAGDVGSRLVQGSAIALQQVEASAAERRLGLRTALTEQSLGNLELQANLLLGQQAADLSDRELVFRQKDSLRSLRASMLDSAFGRRAAIKQTEIGANAQIKSASIGANAAISSARISASASRYGDALRAFIEGEKLQEGSRQFNENLSLQRFLGEEDIRLRGEEIQLGRSQIKAQKQNNTLNALAGLAGTAATAAIMFSDERLKQGIAPVSGAIEKLRQIRGVTWEWKHDPGKRTGGVLAQEVRMVLPEAVHPIGEGANPTLAVDYGAIIALLLEALKELDQRVQDLEKNNA